MLVLQGNVAGRAHGTEDEASKEDPDGPAHTGGHLVSVSSYVCVMPAVERMLLVHLSLLPMCLSFIRSLACSLSLTHSLTHSPTHSLTHSLTHPSQKVAVAALMLLLCVQDAETNWQFDIFAFADATPGTTLAVMTFHLLKQANCMHDFGVDPAKFWTFLQKIEQGYKAGNPYHNSVHAASVVQMTYMLLCHGGPMKTGAVGRLQLFCSCWSAAVHDFEHGGLNNDFLIKTSNPLALTYNDQSPLENHHVSAAMKLLGAPDSAYLVVI